MDLQLQLQLQMEREGGGLIGMLVIGMFFFLLFLWRKGRRFGMMDMIADVEQAVCYVC